MLVKQPLGLVLLYSLAHRDQPLAGHQFVDLLARIGGKAHVAVGEDADEAAGRLAAETGVLDHGNAGNAVRLHQFERIGQGRIGADGDRIDHHAALELLDLANFLGLRGRVEIAVNDAHAAGLRHGDGEARLGHRVHGRGEDRQRQVNVARDRRADNGLARHDFRVAGLQEHVVKGKRLGAGNRL